MFICYFVLFFSPNLTLSLSSACTSTKNEHHTRVKVYVVCLFGPLFFFFLYKSAVVFSDLTHHSSTKPSPAGLSEWSTWWRIYWTTMENAIGNFFSEKMITGLEAVKWQLWASCQTSVLKNHARQQIESQNNYSPPLHYYIKLLDCLCRAAITGYSSFEWQRIRF